MLSPESAEEKEGAWRLRVEREMLTLSDAEIDHGLGAIGGGGGSESVEGGAFPDPKRRRLVEKLEIVVEDDEGMEEDKEEDEGKEEDQKMEEIGIDTDAKEKEKTELGAIEIAKSRLGPMGRGLSDPEVVVIMSMRRHAMEGKEEEDEGKEEDKEEQKMEEIGIDTDAKEKEKEKEKTDLDLIEIAKSMGRGLSDREMDAIMSMRRRAMPMDSSDDDEEVEEEVDEKVKELLDNVEKASACVRRINVHHVDLPIPKFFLLGPWGSDIDCSYKQIEARRLDSFYKRLVPTVESERYFPIRYFWNRLPEVDSQYVYLFTKLDESDLLRQKSLSFYWKEPSHTSKHADYLEARDIVRSLNLDKLRDEDIEQCFMDVIVDRDRIAEYKLKTEWDLFLLDCRYDQNLDFTNFKSKDHSPIMDRQHINLSERQLRFDRWMEKKLSGLQKEECKLAIRNHYEKMQKEEDLNYRIHYIRYKRRLAKELGLIP